MKNIIFGLIVNIKFTTIKSPLFLLQNFIFLFLYYMSASMLFTFIYLPFCNSFCCIKEWNIIKTGEMIYSDNECFLWFTSQISCKNTKNEN